MKPTKLIEDGSVVSLDDIVNQYKIGNDASATSAGTINQMMFIGGGSDFTANGPVAVNTIEFGSASSANFALSQTLGTNMVTFDAGSTGNVFAAVADATRVTAQMHGTDDTTLIGGGGTATVTEDGTGNTIIARSTGDVPLNVTATIKGSDALVIVSGSGQASVTISGYSDTMFATGPVNVTAMANYDAYAVTMVGGAGTNNFYSGAYESHLVGGADVAATNHLDTYGTYSTILGGTGRGNVLTAAGVDDTVIGHGRNDTYNLSPGTTAVLKGIGVNTVNLEPYGSYSNPSMGVTVNGLHAWDVLDISNFQYNARDQKLDSGNFAIDPATGDLVLNYTNTTGDKVSFDMHGNAGAIVTGLGGVDQAWGTFLQVHAYDGGKG